MTNKLKNKVDLKKDIEIIRKEDQFYYDVNGLRYIFDYNLMSWVCVDKKKSSTINIVSFIFVFFLFLLLFCQ